MTHALPYAELFIAEGENAAVARAHAEEMGISPVSPGTGAALTVLVAAVQAKNVVEVGTGTGVSGLHLFAGMAAGGILTSIDVETEHQRIARQMFTDAGVAAGEHD